MTHLAPRPWVPNACEAHVQLLAAQVAAPSATVAARIDQLIDRNLEIHDRDCFNLNPATNVMNPRAEAALARGLGSRPSLGYPGDKYEVGLDAIEQIEVMAAELAAEVFGHVAAGRIRIEVNQRYALADAQQAHRDLESRQTTGSSVFVI